MNDLDSSIMCCISGCPFLGGHQDSEGRLFCTKHWEEHTKKDPVCSSGCGDCENSRACEKCAVPGCENKGPWVVDHGKQYCVKHVWKTDRHSEERTGEPLRADWDDLDAIRAHGMGIAIEKE